MLGILTNYLNDSSTLTKTTSTCFICTNMQFICMYLSEIHTKKYNTIPDYVSHFCFT